MGKRGAAKVEGETHVASSFDATLFIDCSNDRHFCGPEICPDTDG